MRQEALVLEHLQAHGTITSREAMLDLGIMQLPRRILDLRHSGHDIATEYTHVINRRGERVRIGVYTLRGTA